MEIVKSNTSKISKKIVSLVILIVSIFASFYIMFKSSGNQNGFNIIWLLPLLYGFLYFFSNLKFAIFDYLSIFILNIIMFFRYVISPLYSSATSLFFHSNAITTSEMYNKKAILLMIYELFCICIFMHFFIKRLNIEKDKIAFSRFRELKFSGRPVKENFYIYYFAIIIGIFAFIIFPGVRGRANFFTIDEISSANLNAISSFGFIFASNIFKIIFIIIVSKQLYKIKLGQKPNKILVYTALILCISFVASTNRTTVIVQSLACLAVLKKINLLDMRNLIISGVICVTIVLSLTAYRHFETGNISMVAFVNENVNTEQVNVNNLQSYFGGPHLIALAIKDKQSFSGNLETFFNEILSSIIFVRQVIPLSKLSSTVLFNKNFGFFEHNSMILPTLAQGYYYFGMLGAPLLSILFCYLIFLAEKKIIKTNDIGKQFALYILVSWLGLFPLQNLNIVTASIFNTFLPLYIIVYFNSKFHFTISH